MNEIQRFKKDRMIVKALGGTKTRYDAGNLVHAGRDTWGDYLYYDNRTGDLVKVSSDPDKLKRDGFAIGSIARNAAELKTNPYASHGINWGWNPFKPIDTHTFGSYQGKLQGLQTSSNGITVNGKKYASKTDWLKRVGLSGQLTAVVTNKTTSRPGRISKGLQYWDNEFATFTSGLSQEQQNWLKQNGLDNANALQTYLNANNYYDGGMNVKNVDNKFGGNSKAAWDKFVASGNMGKNRDLEILAEKLAAQPVVDAPDPFGYLSKGNYSLENLGKLRADGIRDWTTMMNYIKGNLDSDFAKDMMHRFGSDLSQWKQEDVESSIGIGGHYGRKDRSRILGFMTGNQVNWDNQRLQAINDYAKKTFLSNPTGANTLGDAGAGTMNNQKQLAYADK